MSEAAAGAETPAAREVLVGWRNSSPQASLAFFPPEPLGETEAAALTRQFAAPGPLNDLPRRLIRVRAPYDLRIKVSPPGMGPARLARVPKESTLSEEGFRGLITPIMPTAQRNPQTVAVQISLNLFFVCDEDCTLQLLPPFFSPNFRRWPGPIVSGRFPLRSWPRPINCVVEWQDRDRDWVIRRGDDLAYLMFSFDDPATLPRMVEARNTPALARHVRQVNDVSSFGRNVGPMFAEAARRRPARLLVPKRIGDPGWEPGTDAPGTIAEAMDAGGEDG